jgi:hypothetical protein
MQIGTMQENVAEYLKGQDNIDAVLSGMQENYRYIPTDVLLVELNQLIG